MKTTTTIDTDWMNPLFVVWVLEHILDEYLGYSSASDDVLNLNPVYIIDFFKAPKLQAQCCKRASEMKFRARGLLGVYVQNEEKAALYLMIIPK